MDDMNEHRDPQSGPQQGTPPARPTPPAPRDPASAASRCATSTGCGVASTDRYIAGVAGGLGRHFDIDPTVIRVVLVVLTFFGGAGILLYGVIWLFVPEDGEEHAPVDLSPDVLKIVLIVDRRGRADDRLRHPVLQQQLGLGLPRSRW